MLRIMANGRLNTAKANGAIVGLETSCSIRGEMCGLMSSATQVSQLHLGDGVGNAFLSLTQPIREILVLLV